MQHIIFDLDGTISNPEQGILNGYKYTFPKVNLPTPSDEQLRQLIGPPLRIVFEEVYNLPKDEADFAITTYRKYYNEMGGAYENNLYDGMKELLQQLKSDDKTLHIATHKSAMAEKILEHFDIKHHFSQIQYYNETRNITTKEMMIDLILQAAEIPDKSKVVMIGDRHTDIEAAHYTGIKSIGVTYGFGSKEEIIGSRPDFIAEDVQDLHAVLHQFSLSSQG
jgi:phosphoglycolate phosphatase